jgi:hypothetical protein
MGLVYWLFGRFSRLVSTPSHWFPLILTWDPSSHWGPVLVDPKNPQGDASGIYSTTYHLGGTMKFDPLALSFENV